VTLRALLVAGIMLAWSSAPALAAPEAMSREAYAAGLGRAATEVTTAQGLQGAARTQAIARATGVLEGLTAVQVGDVVYRPPHGAVMALLRSGDGGSLQRAAAILQETRALVAERGALPEADPQTARRQLEAILLAPDFKPRYDWRQVLVAWLAGLLQRFFPHLDAPEAATWAIRGVIALFALALLTLMGAVLSRGFGERLRREAVLRTIVSAPALRARAHLAEAEAALQGGRLREAVRALYLFTLLSLEERGLLRYDPALTDQEVLARAAALEQVGDLEALVAVYERAWYGLREPTGPEVARARSLAGRIAA
jgi:hypothetical protein